MLHHACMGPRCKVWKRPNAIVAVGAMPRPASKRGQRCRQSVSFEFRQNTTVVGVRAVSSLPTSGWAAAGSNRSPTRKFKAGRARSNDHPREPPSRLSYDKASTIPSRMASLVMITVPSHLTQASTYSASVLVCHGREMGETPCTLCKLAPEPAQQKQGRCDGAQVGKPRRSQHSAQSPLSLTIAPLNSKGRPERPARPASWGASHTPHIAPGCRMRARRQGTHTPMQTLHQAVV
jgi:hypothetical protein